MAEDPKNVKNISNDEHLKKENENKEELEKTTKETATSARIEDSQEEYTDWTLDQLASEMTKILKTENAGAQGAQVSKIKDAFRAQLEKEIASKKEAFIKDGGNEEDFDYQPAVKNKFDGLLTTFKEKQNAFLEKQKSEQDVHLKERENILNRLKELYTNADPGTNLFKEIRKIKEDWSNAGFIPRTQFKRLQQDYYFHLDQFYAMLDLNQEYREQEYEHNLQKRYHIIDRVKELIEEPIVRKALNELQFLHKLWKEEAVPVAEEFREATWQEFKKLSNEVLERKKELFDKLEKEYEDNLIHKNKIIEKLKELAQPTKKAGHSYWQNALKKVDALRKDFIATGKVPKGEAGNNWASFKEALKSFNTAKNDFYKERKQEQQDNLQKKLDLIQTAKDNQDSEDWDTSLSLFKNIQEQWKSIGHVPRSKSDQIWNEFQEACNHFFDRYRDKTGNTNDDWEKNYETKKELLSQLKEIKKDDEEAANKINEIKNQWNATGKVPRSKININKEFNKTLKSKMEDNHMSIYDLEDNHLSERQVTDKARKLKKQIEDLETDISNLENNLAYFTNPSRENPLLKDTYNKLDSKKEELENLREALHQMIEEAEENKAEQENTEEKDQEN